MQQERRRILLDMSGLPCRLCGSATVVAQSRAVRRGAAWLNPWWDPEVRVYEVCGSCGARHLIGGHLAD